MFPLPFSRGVFVVGEPVRHEKGEDVEEYRLRIENALRGVTAKADEMAGNPAGRGEGIGEGREIL